MARKEPAMGEADLEAGWRLEGRDGEGRPLRFTIGAGELTRSYLGIALGRHPALCHRVVDDPSISRRHLRLGRAASGLFVEDLNSLNGSSLDGAALQPFFPVPIEPGQNLELGRVSLRLLSLDAGEAEEGTDETPPGLPLEGERRPE